MNDENIKGGVITQLMHTDCPLDREPTAMERGIAYAYGQDDGDWCRENDVEAYPPRHLRHPAMVEEWRQGYESTRRISKSE